MSYDRKSIMSYENKFILMYERKYIVYTKEFVLFINGLCNKHSSGFDAILI